MTLSAESLLLVHSNPRLTALIYSSSLILMALGAHHNLTYSSIRLIRESSTRALLRSRSFLQHLPIRVLLLDLRRDERVGP